jgi:hypothetical protein
MAGSRSDLGHLSKVGIASTLNRITSGAWVVTYRQQDLPREAFEVWHGAARGPGGYFLVFLDDHMYGVGENGAINEYTPAIPMFVRPGQEITLHWSIATGTAPTVTLYFRKPEVGRL